MYELEWNSDLLCAIEHHDVLLAVITPLELDYYLRRLGMTALCQTNFLFFKTLGLRINLLKTKRRLLYLTL